MEKREYPLDQGVHPIFENGFVAAVIIELDGIRHRATIEKLEDEGLIGPEPLKVLKPELKKKILKWAAYYFTIKKK